MMPIWLASRWRSIAVLAVVGGLGGGMLWYRAEAADAQRSTAVAERDRETMRGAYLSLAGAIQRQNAAVLDLEQKAAEAARRGAQARSEAAGAVDVAMRSAEALSRRLSEPATTDCPAGDGLAVVREDWRR